jgi:hypothetical protein
MSGVETGKNTVLCGIIIVLIMVAILLMLSSRVDGLESSHKAWLDGRQAEAQKLTDEMEISGKLYKQVLGWGMEYEQIRFKFGIFIVDNKISNLEFSELKKDYDNLLRAEVKQKFKLK